MAQKTSINIKPCNIGSSEAHNRRTAEYLAKHPQGGSSTSVPTSWLETRHGSHLIFSEATLTDRYNQIAAMVKEKDRPCDADQRP